MRVYAAQSTQRAYFLLGYIIIAGYISAVCAFAGNAGQHKKCRVRLRDCAGGNGTAFRRCHGMRGVCTVQAVEVPGHGHVVQGLNPGSAAFLIGRFIGIQPVSIRNLKPGFPQPLIQCDHLPAVHGSGAGAADHGMPDTGPEQRKPGTGPERKNAMVFQEHHAFRACAAGKHSVRTFKGRDGGIRLYAGSFPPADHGRSSPS